jgi:DNA-binding IclR family transcriptional regulator
MKNSDQNEVAASVKPSPHLSIQKAFAILELLAEQSPRGVTEIASALKLEKSGLSRLLKSLAGLGYVVQTAERGQYQISPRILTLAQQFLEGDRLIQEAQPVLRSLAQEARATAHLGMLVQGHSMVVAKEPSPERIQVSTRVGVRIAPHASALGKVLLASMSDPDLARFARGTLTRYTEKTLVDPKKLIAAVEEVRRRGYSFETEEEHRGVGCIGAPVRDASGRWIAALSIAGPIQGTPFKLDPAHVAMLQRHADELSRRVSMTERKMAG